MKLNPATIRIKNLRLRTYIGVNDDEIINMQDVVINVKMHYCADQATDSDQMDDALNYKTITKRIINLVENNRFFLLEKLTADVLAYSRLIYSRLIYRPRIYSPLITYTD